MDDGNWVQFEDDYFEAKEGKRAQENLSFKPLNCYPKWFFNEGEVETAESLQNQANYCYWTKDYSKAAILYEKALNDHFAGSHFMKRNLLESIARCHFQLGDITKARVLAEECLSLSYTVELKSSILDFLINVYEKCGDFSMQKKTFFQLIAYHPHNYRIWWDLALCLSKFKKSGNMKEDLLMLMMEAACLIRVTMIIGTLKNQEGSLVLKNAEEKLSSMDLPENFVSTGKKFYSRDLLEEHLAAEKEKELSKPDGTSVMVDAVMNEESNECEIKWFKWIYNFLK